MNIQLAKEILMKNGITEEEMEGLDVIRLVKDYEIDQRDYTTEEIREIIADEIEFYHDSKETALYSVLEEQGNANLEEDAVIAAVAYEYNNGSYYERGYIDLAEGYVCADTADKKDLAPEFAEKILEMVSKYEIFKWKHDYRGEEPKSTGSLGWKIVFRTRDNTYYVYGGFTSDGSHLPDHYDEVIGLLRSAVGRE